MHSVFATAPAASAIPITFATKATWEGISAELAPPVRRFAQANGFAAKPGAYLALPSAGGDIAQVLFGLEEETARLRDPFRPGALPGLLPAGVYRFANAPHDTRLATLAFALGTYRFGRYRKTDLPDVKLVPPDGIDTTEITPPGGSGGAGPRPHQHAGDRHGTGTAGGGRAAACRALRREGQLHRRRRAGAAEFSADLCGRHGLDPRRPA